VSAKPFTLYGHVPSNVLYAKYNNLSIEKTTRIHCGTPPSWFRTVNRLEPSSQGLIRIGFGFADGIRNPMNAKPVSVRQMKYIYIYYENRAQGTAD